MRHLLYTYPDTQVTTSPPKREREERGMELLERKVKKGEEERRDEQRKQQEKATQESQPNQHLNLSLAR
jgi:hypothetical protein